MKLVTILLSATLGGGVAGLAACSSGYQATYEIEPSAIAGTYRVESAAANVRGVVRFKDGSNTSERDSIFITGGGAYECQIRLMVERGGTSCDGFRFRVTSEGLLVTYRACSSRQVPFERTVRDATTGETRTVQDERTVTECRTVPAVAEKLP